MALDADALFRRLRGLPPATGLRIAYSGGVDSSVLLHLLAELRDRLPPLSALHVHHGLSEAADRWAEHCRETCERLGVPLEIRHVDATPRRRESPEAAARCARRAAFADCLGAGEGLLTAQHRDDQAESLLLALLRGSGPAGLAAMPRWMPFAEGWMGRPLLDWPRSEILATAHRLGIDWVEDPSNTSVQYDRNYLRHVVLPQLTERWPAAPERIAYGARLQAEALALQHELARLDAERCSGVEPGTLSVPELGTLSHLRQRNLLRWWLQDKGLPLPGSHRLEAIRAMLEARPDARPKVRWPGGEARRWRDALYAGPPLPDFDRCARHPWPAGRDTTNPATGEPMRWHALQRTLEGLEYAPNALSFGFRQGGERLRPHPGAPRRPLKALLREAGVPPWMRDRIPLIYEGERLLGVLGLWANHSPDQQQEQGTS